MGVTRPMIAEIGIDPKYRPSSEVGPLGINTKISPFGSLPQPLHATRRRPHPSTGRARATTGRASIETSPSCLQAVSPRRWQHA